MMGHVCVLSSSCYMCVSMYVYGGTCVCTAGGDEAAKYLMGHVYVLSSSCYMCVRTGATVHTHGWRRGSQVPDPELSLVFLHIYIYIYIYIYI